MDCSLTNVCSIKVILLRESILAWGTEVYYMTDQISDDFIYYCKNDENIAFSDKK